MNTNYTCVNCKKSFMIHDAKKSYNNYFILCVNCPTIKSHREEMFIDEDFGPDDNEYYYDDHLEQ